MFNLRYKCNNKEVKQYIHGMVCKNNDEYIKYNIRMYVLIFGVILEHINIK